VGRVIASRRYTRNHVLYIYITSVLRWGAIVGEHKKDANGASKGMYVTARYELVLQIFLVWSEVLCGASYSVAKIHAKSRVIYIYY